MKIYKYDKQSKSALHLAFLIHKIDEENKEIKSQKFNIIIYNNNNNKNNDINIYILSSLLSLIRFPKFQF
jgi:hypothetical protein